MQATSGSADLGRRHRREFPLPARSRASPEPTCQRQPRPGCLLPWSLPNARWPPSAGVSHARRPAGRSIADSGTGNGVPSDPPSAEFGLAACLDRRVLHRAGTSWSGPSRSWAVTAWPPDRETQRQLAIRLHPLTTCNPAWPSLLGQIEDTSTQAGPTTAHCSDPGAVRADLHCAPVTVWRSPNSRGTNV